MSNSHECCIYVWEEHVICKKDCCNKFQKFSLDNQSNLECVGDRWGS